MAWSRAASSRVAVRGVCSASATASSTGSALGSGLPPWAGARPSTGLCVTSPRGPTSGTGRARPPARWRCCAGQAVRAQPAAQLAHVVHLGRVAAPPVGLGRCAAGGAGRRRTSPACAAPGAAPPRRCCRKAAARAPAWLVGSGGRRRLGPASAALRQQPRQRRAGHLADAHQELGAHVGAVARGVGRAQHQQAEGRASAPWRSGIIASDITVAGRPASAASKPAFTPQ
jgi:hypothetical protein